MLKSLEHWSMPYFYVLFVFLSWLNRLKDFTSQKRFMTHNLSWLLESLDYLLMSLDCSYLKVRVTFNLEKGIYEYDEKHTKENYNLQRRNQERKPRQFTRSWLGNLTSLRISLSVSLCRIPSPFFLTFISLACTWSRLFLSTQLTFSHFHLLLFALEQL